MADAIVKYAESVAATTASSTAWVDLASIANTEFEANKTYLILANQICKINDATSYVRARLVHGTTPTVFDDASSSWEGLANTQEHELSYMFLYTQPATAELIKLQISTNGTDTVTNIFSQIIAIKLSDDFVSGTDYFFNEDLIDYTMTATATDKATTASFTPNGSDRWLYIANIIYDVAGLTTPVYFALEGSIGGTINVTQQEGEDTNDILSHNLYWAGVPTNASRTISVVVLNSGSAVLLSSRIIAINLAKFAQSDSVFNGPDVDPATSPTYTTVATLSPTPATTGNWVIIGSILNDVNEATTDFETRMQINPSGGGLADDPPYPSTPPSIDQWDVTDWTQHSIFNLASLTSGAAREINFDVRQVAGTTGRVARRFLVAFSVALSTAVNTTTEKPAFLKGANSTSDNQIAYQNGDAGKVDIQGNQGRLLVGAISGAVARAIANVTEFSEHGALFQITFSDTNAAGSFRLFLRSSGDWFANDRPITGYELRVQNSSTSVEINKIVAGTRSNLATNSDWTITTTQTWIRFEASDGVIKYKFWTGSEPAAWTRTFANNDITSIGKVQFGYAYDSGTEAKQLLLDNFTIYVASWDFNPAYLNGASGGTDVSSSKASFLKGNSNAITNKSAFSKGSSDTISSKSAFLQGQVSLTSAVFTYTKGQDSSTSSITSYVIGTASASISKTSFLKGQDTATSSKASYLTGRQDTLDSQAAFAVGVLAAITSKSAFLYGSVNVTNSQSAFTEGVFRSSKSAFLVGSIDATDAVFAFLKGENTDKTSKSSFLQGINASNSQKAAYLFGQALSAESTPAFTSGSSILSSALNSFLLGSISVSSSKDAWLKGSDDVISELPAYLAGVIRSQKSAYLNGGILTSSSKSVFISGQSSFSFSKTAYLRGSSSLQGNQPGYLEGDQQAQDSTLAYTRGQDSSLSELPAYLIGGTQESDSQLAFTAGQDIVEDQQPVYLYGQADTASQQPAYLNGLDYTQSDTPAYLYGQQDISTQQSSYLLAEDYEKSSNSAYLKGRNDASSSQSAYLLAQDTSSSSQKAYLIGGTQAIDSTPAFIAVNATSLSALPSYVFGYSANVSSLPAFLKGQDSSSSFQNSYTSGIERSLKSAYLSGASLVSGFVPSYVDGEAVIISSVPVFIKGSIDTSLSEPAFLSGQINTASSKTVYLAGQNTASASADAFIAGNAVITSEQSAYLTGTGQYLLPVSDITIGGWINEASGSILYPSLADGSDATYAWYQEATVNAYFEVKIDIPGNVPAGEHYFRWRAYRKAGALTVTLKCEIRQGAAVIADNSQVLTDDIAEYTRFLTAEEIAAITDYTDLRARVIITGVT